MADIGNLLAALATAAATAAVSLAGGKYAWDQATKAKQYREAQEAERRTALEREFGAVLSEAVNATTQTGIHDRNIPLELDFEMGSVRREVESAVETFRERLERIEERFPEEATLEKIASINDAILATKIELLEKSIESLESRILSKWDVAMVFFQVIGTIGVIAAIIFTVATFVLK
jgi:uncharacterized membrane protein YccC